MDFFGIGRRGRDALFVEPAGLVVPLEFSGFGPVHVPRREDLVRVADALEALHLRGEPGALRGAVAALPLAPVQGADAHGVPRGDKLPRGFVDDDAREDAVEAVPDLVDVAEGLEKVADDRRVRLGVVDDFDAFQVLFFEIDVVVDLGVAVVMFSDGMERERKV